MTNESLEPPVLKAITEQECLPGFSVTARYTVGSSARGAAYTH